jgi:hypothetical protein
VYLQTAGASAEAKNGNAKFEAATRVEAGADSKCWNIN